MATIENSSPPKPHFETDSGPTPSVSDTLVQSLIQGFHNAVLKENDEATNNIYFEGDSDTYGEEYQYPLRPYAEDCSYYLRTGTCKFGLNCKFNHPVGRSSHVAKEREKEGYEFSDKTAQITCKYYLSAGGCKFGEACRYNHSKEKNVIVSSDYNFLGLPMRLGEKECSYYMRYGSCGYGAMCRFHHPNPSVVGGSSSYAMINSDEPVLQKLLGSSTSPRASSSLNMLSSKTLPFSDDSSFYVNEMHSLPQKMYSTAEQNGFQAPMSSIEKTMHPYSAPAANNPMKKTEVSAHQQIQAEEFPERPGNPDCDYFMKTGDCKYKSACRYHHPKNRPPQSAVCVLSDKGLPLRPGSKICWHYERFGICKYGQTCLFDHPLNLNSSANPVESVEPVFQLSSDTNSASLEVGAFDWDWN